MKQSCVLTPAKTTNLHRT